MRDDLTALVCRCVEVRIIHHFAGAPTTKVEVTDGGYALRRVPGDEQFTILARKAWDGVTMRGEGKTIGEAVRKIHD